MHKLPIVTKRNTSLSIPNEFVSGPESIIGAFEAVLQVANKSDLQEEKLQEAHASFDFLQKKLKITTFQAILLAMCIDHVTPLQPRQMAGFLGTSNIRVLSLMNELQDLIDRRLIRAHEDQMEHTLVYQLRQEVLHAYMKNKVYVSRSNSRLSLSKLFDRLGELYQQCDNDEIEPEELQTEVKDIIAKNQRHEVCKLMKGRDLAEQLLFMFCCTTYVLEGDDDISSMQYRNFFPGLRFRSMCNQLSTGKHPLMKEGLLVHSATDGYANRDGITISEELRKKLTIELNLEWDVSNQDDDKRGLLLCENIQAKELFFNQTEDQSVVRLSDLLQEDNYQHIRQRLSDTGMRKGFACLLYGLPGTGKTETVLQLAKATGRNVMEVNISQIKSKWVGDTEKNIKNIFDRYRNYCKKCDIAPILLFNEADAIINNRNTSATSSVDKMENAMQNIILEEMEKLDGILIATTNLTSNMDPAFERRFIYKIEFHKPEPAVKVAIWQSMLKELTREDAEKLSSKYDFSGGQIENIVRKQMIDSILYNKSLTLENLDEYCQMEQIHKDSHHTIAGFR